MKITMKGQQVTLLGNPIKIGDTIRMVATTPELKEFNLKDIKGKKVISVVPSVDTSTCSLQTSTIAQIQKRYKDVTFITISLDLPFAQGRWCQANGKNVMIVSDYKTREFGKNYGFLIDGLFILTRGLIILDEHNGVLDFEYTSEVTEEPDYSLIEKTLSE